MNKKIFTLLTSAVLLALPVVSLAVNLIPLPGIILNPGNIFDALFNILWPFFAGFAVIMFIVAGFLFLTAQGDPEKVNQARQATLWGVVGVIVGLIAFSIPFIVRVTLGSGI